MYIALGKIGAPWGLKGETKIHLYNPESEVLKKTRLIYFKAGFAFQEHKLLSFRKQGAFFVLAVEGFSSPEEIKKLQGEELYVSQDALPAKKSGEFFVHELVGMKVLDEAGNELGEVQGLENYGSTDLLKICSQAAENSQEHLIPWIPDMIVSVDEKSRQIVIRKMEGLLD